MTSFDQGFSTNKKFQPKKLTNQKTAGTKCLSAKREQGGNMCVRVEQWKSVFDQGIGMEVEGSGPGVYLVGGKLCWRLELT